MSTDTGEKPFHCDICGFRFSQNSLLKQDMYAYTGENTSVTNLIQLFTRELHKTISKFSLGNLTNKDTNIQNVYNPTKLKTCSKLWIQIDRIYKPYTDPFEILEWMSKCYLIKMNDDVQIHVSSYSLKTFIET